MAKSKEKKVIVQDNTEPQDNTENNDEPQVKVSKKLASRVEAMSPEEKAAFAAQLGLPVKKIRAPKPKEPTARDLFLEANEKLQEQVDSIHTILDGCEFPGGFSLTIGKDHEGKQFAKAKQVRTPYGPRSADEKSA